MILPIKPPKRSKKEPVPRLRDGERLDAEEFHRRYLEMPDVRAELIEGVVHRSSPVSLDHGMPHFNMAGVLFNYIMSTPGVEGTDNTSLRPNKRNENQPDLMLFIQPELGGGIRSGFPLQGRPELINC